MHWFCLKDIFLIRPKSDHCLQLSLTALTRAFEDANSDVDAEERVGSVVPLAMFLINEP